MIAISKLAALLPIVSFGLAAPLTDLSSRQTEDVSQCKPNFQGDLVSIFIVDPNDAIDDRVLEWSAGNFEGSPVLLRSKSSQEGLQVGDFLIEFTGQPEQTYKIKLAEDTTRSLVASVSQTSGDFVFANMVQGDRSQDFDLDCNLCTDSGLAAGCQVSHPPTGQCVTVNPTGGHWADGERLVLGSCTEAGRFHFIPQLSPEDAATVQVDPLRN